MIPRWPRFHARYPDIQIDLGVSDRAVDLVGENVDCVVRAGEITDQSLIARRVAEFPLRLVRVAFLSGAPWRAAAPGRTGAESHRGRYFSRSRAAVALTFVRNDEREVVMGAISWRSTTATPYVAAGLAGLGIITAPLS